MTESAGKLAILADTLVAKLSEELQNQPDQPAQLRMREAFQRQAERYTTLYLMHELPDYAEPALAAFRQMLDSPAEADSRALLTLLADVYRSAANQ